MSSTEYIDVRTNIVLMRVTGSGFNEGNVTCIEFDDKLVFIDAGRKAKAVRNFRSKMEERFGKQTSMVLLTHTHQDHYFGIEAFKDVPIITTYPGLKAVADNLGESWSHEGRIKTIEEVKGFFREKNEPLPERFKGWDQELLATKLVSPTFGVKDEIKLESSNGCLFYRTIGGHSECSAYLYYEPENILITGDNLVAEHAGNSACMLAGFDVQGIEILQKFEDYNANILIPGHGPVVDTNYVRKSRKWFIEMFDYLRGLKEKETPVDEVVVDSSLPSFFEENRPNQWNNILSFWYEKV
ncbi:MAG: MBL fold metallo-hydrolase, partial [Candidatus Thorarchaeota archaeon]